jgi:hypothetical protein
MCVFVSGVFLDNLRNISKYRSGYDSCTEGADSIHMHHGLGLEDGALVRRSDLLTMRYAQDIEHLTGQPDETAVTDRSLGMGETVSVGAVRGGGKPSSTADPAADGGRETHSSADHDGLGDSSTETDGGDG